MIISASRRTDIPAYYSDWFMESLKKGWVDVKNPFNSKQISKISLKQEDVDCFVFWTKNPASFLTNIPVLDNMGYQYYFQFTLNPYSYVIEKNLPIKKSLTETFKKLSDRIGCEKVVWRYDPIIITEELDINYHLSMFNKYCSGLKGYTNRVIISFVEEYRKISKRLCAIGYKGISKDLVIKLGKGLKEISLDNNIEIFSCSQKWPLDKLGIKKGSCIDGDLINKITSNKIKHKKDNSQRENCGCAKSRDIGFYNSCNHGCIYCYANK